MKIKKFIVNSLLILAVILALGGAFYFLSWQVRLVWVEITQNIDHETIRDMYFELLKVKILPVFAPAVILALGALHLHEKLRRRWQIPIC